MGSLECKVALVTGAGQGIGKAIAEALAREGADIVANDLPRNSDADTDGLDETVANVESAGKRAMQVRADVSDRDAVHSMFNRAVAEFGHVDIVVSNAAYNCRQPLIEADPKEMRAKWKRPLRALCRPLEGLTLCTTTPAFGARDW